MSCSPFSAQLLSRRVEVTHWVLMWFSDSHQMIHSCECKQTHTHTHQHRLRVSKCLLLVYRVLKAFWRNPRAGPSSQHSNRRWGLWKEGLPFFCLILHLFVWSLKWKFLFVPFVPTFPHFSAQLFPTASLFLYPFASFPLCPPMCSHSHLFILLCLPLCILPRVCIHVGKQPKPCNYCDPHPLLNSTLALREMLLLSGKKKHTSPNTCSL